MQQTPAFYMCLRMKHSVRLPYAHHLRSPAQWTELGQLGMGPLSHSQHI